MSQSIENIEVLRSAENARKFFEENVSFIDTLMKHRLGSKEEVDPLLKGALVNLSKYFQQNELVNTETRTVDQTKLKNYLASDGYENIKFFDSFQRVAYAIGKNEDAIKDAIGDEFPSFAQEYQKMTKSMGERFLPKDKDGKMISNPARHKSASASLAYMARTVYSSAGFGVEKEAEAPLIPDLTYASRDSLEKVAASSLGFLESSKTLNLEFPANKDADYHRVMLNASLKEAGYIMPGESPLRTNSLANQTHTTDTDALQKIAEHAKGLSTFLSDPTYTSKIKINGDGMLANEQGLSLSINPFVDSVEKADQSSLVILQAGRDASVFPYQAKAILDYMDTVLVVDENTLKGMNSEIANATDKSVAIERGEDAVLQNEEITKELTAEASFVSNVQYDVEDGEVRAQYDPNRDDFNQTPEAVSTVMVRFEDIKKLKEVQELIKEAGISDDLEANYNVGFSRDSEQTNFGRLVKATESILNDPKSKAALASKNPPEYVVVQESKMDIVASNVHMITTNMALLPIARIAGIDADKVMKMAERDQAPYATPQEASTTKPGERPDAIMNKKQRIPSELSQDEYKKLMSELSPTVRGEVKKNVIAFDYRKNKATKESFAKISGSEPSFEQSVKGAEEIHRVIGDALKNDKSGNVLETLSKLSESRGKIIVAETTKEAKTLRILGNIAEKQLADVIKVQDDKWKENAPKSEVIIKREDLAGFVAQTSRNENQLQGKERALLTQDENGTLQINHPNAAGITIASTKGIDQIADAAILINRGKALPENLGMISAIPLEMLKDGLEKSKSEYVSVKLAGTRTVGIEEAENPNSTRKNRRTKTDMER